MGNKETQKLPSIKLKWLGVIVLIIVCCALLTGIYYMFDYILSLSFFKGVESGLLSIYYIGKQFFVSEKLLLLEDLSNTEWSKAAYWFYLLGQVFGVFIIWFIIWNGLKLVFNKLF